MDHHAHEHRQDERAHGGKDDRDLNGISSRVNPSALRTREPCPPAQHHEGQQDGQPELPLALRNARAQKVAPDFNRLQDIRALHGDHDVARPQPSVECHCRPADGCEASHLACFVKEGHAGGGDQKREAHRRGKPQYEYGVGVACEPDKDHRRNCRPSSPGVLAMESLC